jgi:hypothetical protein
MCMKKAEKSEMGDLINPRDSEFATRSVLWLVLRRMNLLILTWCRVFRSKPVYLPASEPEPEPEVQFVRLPFLQGCLGSTLTHSGV